ncbi:MAG TPA: UTP--glucose-1-phosphate uridylyltransferase [Candidatus Saccharimonadales bacterium]|nr:UTP--glucose-1-phosphate uridylyltransferase [Candidatus Saccharimonadales bacterium]
MSDLVGIITASDPDIRDQSLEAFCRSASAARLLAECEELDRFRRTSDNLYQRVRAHFFLYAIHRFYLPRAPGMRATGLVPFSARECLLKRRLDEAIDILLRVQSTEGPSGALSSGLAAAYRGLAFQTLANQVRHSVRSVRGNQWLGRVGHPLDYPLTVRRELLTPDSGLYPILCETTPVRMDLSHSGWSDIFFLGMDFPQGARVLNVSINLGVRGARNGEPKPPVEAYFRVIDEPVLRLASVDLGVSTDISTFSEVFDFSRDYLGLLKAAVIASGIVPQAMEGTDAPLESLLVRLTGKPGLGIEIVSRVNDIPKGSRLAVSTSLLACLISVSMRATEQVRSLSGALTEIDRRTVAARAILGEWLAGSGGGWQDSGGLWPGIKLIEGVDAVEGDPEFGISRGCLLPRHHVLSASEVLPQARQRLEESLVLVHGGMAQDVGPVLEMVTERYLLRSEREWQARLEAMKIFDEIVAMLKEGRIDAIGGATERNFFGPIQTIIPWATNVYTEALIRQIRAEFGRDFQGFWMLGGMAGGGMGFLFEPHARARAQDRLQAVMSETKRRLERAVPFAMEPIVYNSTINERGSWADLRRGVGALMSPEYYTLTVPALLRTGSRNVAPAKRAELAQFGQACRDTPAFACTVQELFDHLMPGTAVNGADQPQSLQRLLDEYGFDAVHHEQIRADLRSGRLGLAKNRLSASVHVSDVAPGDVCDASNGLPEQYLTTGMQALKAGTVVVVSLAGGVGSRWTRGAGVVKALDPFVKLGGRYRNFIEIHLAKSRHTSRTTGADLPHVITTSYLTHGAIEAHLKAENNYGYPGPLLLSPGRAIGLRMIPTTRDLRFSWEEVPQQLLDEQAQKVRESLHSALIHWVEQEGEACDYTDNLPTQCLHPVGHWYEVPNMLRNGVLLRLLRENPGVKHLLIHNIDTLGANVDPWLLGFHIHGQAALTTELVVRHLDDHGGGLARVDGRLRLVEGLALPSEEIESGLSYYSSMTMWVDIDLLLNAFALTRADLENASKVSDALSTFSARMPTYITLKDVKKRWGKGQEDILPVAQFEKLWGDMTALPELRCQYVLVPRERGQQLKEPAQLDGWLRDGSAAYVESLCDW